METPAPTVATNPVVEGNGTPPSGPEQMLTELTRCLSEAFAARGRIQLGRGEIELALADLNDAIRLAPDNAEALQLRDVIEQQTGEVHFAEDHPRPSELDESVSAEDVPRQTRFQAGYQVVARYPNLPPGGDVDPLESSFPLTDEGRLEAIAYAREMCSERSRSQREQLYDAYWTHGVDFDTAVIEFRTLSREVYFEKAHDEDDQPTEE